jgi:hypothetical protein
VRDSGCRSGLGPQVSGGFLATSRHIQLRPGSGRFAQARDCTGVVRRVGPWASGPADLLFNGTKIIVVLESLAQQASKLHNPCRSWHSLGC